MTRRPKSDLDQLRELLIWARKEKIALHDVTIGAVSVTIERDHGLVLPERPVASQPRKLTLVQEFAGSLLADMQGQGTTTVEPTVEDEES